MTDQTSKKTLNSNPASESEPGFSFNKGDQIKVTIEKLVFGGEGLARHNGVVIFVPMVAPQDIVLVEITETKKRFAKARMIEVLTKSSMRTEPNCGYYAKCGGCNLQHITYEDQVSIKSGLLNEFVEGFVSKSTTIHPFKASPKAFNYRNRIRLSFKEGRFGYNQRRSHELVEIHRCEIADEKLNSLIPQLKVNYSNKWKANQIELAMTEQLKPEIRGLTEDKNDLFFSQVNTEQNQFLVDYVLGILHRSQTKILIDLYAGHGNFTFSALEKMPYLKIQAVELHPRSVEIAQKRIQDLNLSPRKINFYQGDVALWLKRAKIEETSTVLLDPPRAGCDPQVLRQIGSSQPSNIIYVSCSPDTLSRDLKILVQQFGYQIEEVQGMDMFPQTDHFETVIVLKRS